MSNCISVFLTLKNWIRDLNQTTELVSLALTLKIGLLLILSLFQNSLQNQLKAYNSVTFVLKIYWKRVRSLFWSLIVFICLDLLFCFFSWPAWIILIVLIYTLIVNLYSAHIIRLLLIKSGPKFVAEEVKKELDKSKDNSALHLAQHLLNESYSPTTKCYLNERSPLYVKAQRN